MTRYENPVEKIHFGGSPGSGDTAGIAPIRLCRHCLRRQHCAAYRERIGRKYRNPYQSRPSRPYPHRPGSQRQKKESSSSGKANGFRIQVFSDGRNQSSLEARAKARGNAIVARFPKYRGQVYTYSSAPNWYTRIGNFRTEEEARKALDELKRSFPHFSSEMRVVKSKISTR